MAHAIPSAMTDYVTLGRSGLRVSPLCLGTMTFGEDWGWGCTPDVAREILDAYVEAGGNFIDTANVYTKGHSEAIIGEYLASRQVRRDQLVIATKFVGSLYRGDPNAGGAGRKAIHAQCEASLRRLRTDTIDLYWMHTWDPHTPIEETMRALDDLVRAGKVRYLGVSDTPAWKVVEAQGVAARYGWTPFVGLQIEYSLLERSVEGELIPMAESQGLGVTPWSPLRGGILTGKYSHASGTLSERGDFTNSQLNAQAEAVLDVLLPAAEALGVSPARLALRWVTQQRGVASTLMGVRTLEQLSDNMAALDVSIPPEVAKALHKASVPTLPFPIAFCRAMPAFYANGATINGKQAPEFPLSPERGDTRYEPE